MVHLGRQFLADGLEPPLFVTFMCSTHLLVNSTTLLPEVNVTLTEVNVTLTSNYHGVQSMPTTTCLAHSTPTARTSG